MAYSCCTPSNWRLCRARSRARYSVWRACSCGSGAWPRPPCCIASCIARCKLGCDYMESTACDCSYVAGMVILRHNIHVSCKSARCFTDMDLLFWITVNLQHITAAELDTRRIGRTGGKNTQIKMLTESKFVIPNFCIPNVIPSLMSSIFWNYLIYYLVLVRDGPLKVSAHPNRLVWDSRFQDTSKRNKSPMKRDL
jgi:hypothetical protein